MLVKALSFLLIAFGFGIVQGIPVSSDESGEYNEKVVRSRKAKFTVDGVRYFYDIDMRTDWYAALDYCKNLNMELLEINNSDENKRVIKILDDIGNDHMEFWMGAKRNREGKFIWFSTRKEIKYTNWDAGEPNNASTNENCVHIMNKLKHKYAWNDNVCAKEINFICSKPIPSAAGTTVKFNGLLVGLIVFLKLAFYIKF